MNPKVSIIITTYDRQEQLKETVVSILKQTFSDFELIIIDNYSQFNFLEFISLFEDKRIRAFQNSNNGLIGINRNLGISLANGLYIAFCDDDDLWECNKLELQVQFMDQNPKVDMCCTASSFINNKINKSVLRKTISYLNSYVLSLNLIKAKYMLLIISFITHSSVIFRKEISSKAGFISTDPEINTILDFDYYFRISLTHRIYYLNKKLVQYRLHENQVSYKDISKTKLKVNDVVMSYWEQLDLSQKFIYKSKLLFNF